MNYNLIPVATVKEITGATTDAQAQAQGEAIVGMVQAYLGLVLVKQNFNGEKVTLPYELSRVIKPKYAPINSVASISVITSTGAYEADTAAISVGEYTFEVLPKFWSLCPYPVLPSAIAALSVTYNAGLYNSWSEVPGILQEAMRELLKYKYAAGYVAGFNSEHFGDYSYTKGGFVRGLPVEIAGMLDGLEL